MKYIVSYYKIRYIRSSNNAKRNLNKESNFSLLYK